MLSLMKTFILILLMWALPLQAATGNISPRTVFIQLFEWPWKDIARECELYLGPTGFSAVQISPPQEHLSTAKNFWWERYQVVSYKLESRGGTEAEFRDMIQRCRKVGVEIYADVVINHMTGIDEGGVGSAGTRFQHYEYPGLYSYGDFHHCGRNGDDNIVNFLDLFELQNCELVNLADLATEKESVQKKIASYLNRLIDLGVSGFRIDAAKHIPARDIQSLMYKLKPFNFMYQEIIYDPAGPIRYGEYTPAGSVSAWNYPYALSSGFKNKNIDQLFNIPRDLPESTKAVVFATNHDLERNGDGSLLRYQNNPTLYRLSQIFMLAWPYGYPQLYSGYDFVQYDQGPPVDENRHALPVLDRQGNCVAPFTCEHRLPEIAPMVQFRNSTYGNFNLSNWWSNGHDQLAFGRGSKAFIAMNFSDQILTREFQTSLSPGAYCNILAPDYNVREQSCANLAVVDSRGVVRARLAPYSAMAFISTAQNLREK